MGVLDVMKEVLSQTGSSLLGVIIGGVLVGIGQWLSARATRKAATEAADASRDVAEVGRATTLLELRLKQSELTFAMQLSATREFLTKLDAWDDAIRDISKLGHDESKIPAEYFDGHVGMQRWDAERILRGMKLVVPRSVTSDARSAMKSGIRAITAHESNFHTKPEDDNERRHRTELERIAAIEEFHRLRDAFLDEFQAYVHLEGEI